MPDRTGLEALDSVALGDESLERPDGDRGVHRPAPACRLTRRGDGAAEDRVRYYDHAGQTDDDDGQTPTDGSNGADGLATFVRGGRATRALGCAEGRSAVRRPAPVRVRVRHVTPRRVRDH